MNSRSINVYFLFIIILTAVIGCGDKMQLPTVQINPESFGTNDTSYIHLTPDWDAAALGYSQEFPFTPVDIAGR